MKKLFVITGEHSGDMHAGHVVAELKKILPDLTVEAVGAQNLESAGAKLFLDHSKMGAAGISPKIIIDHLNLGKKIINYLKNEYKPDAVLLVDYGAFNLKISAELKKNNIKCFYYITPQLWATRPWRINAIKKNISKVFCIFPFEKDLYKKNGVEVEYVGHPVVTQLPPRADRADFITQNSLDADKKIVGIFPGSRTMELKYLSSMFLKSAELIKQQVEDVQFVIAQAPNVSDEFMNKYFKNSDITIVKNQNHALLSVADALILASGTVALEAAIYGTPMVISYKAPAVFYFIYLLIRQIKLVSLPNIILNKCFIKELIQHKARPELVAQEITELLTNETKALEMKNNLDLIKNILGDKIASKEVASALKEELLR